MTVLALSTWRKFMLALPWDFRNHGRVTPHSVRTLLHYARFMNVKRVFFKADKAGLVLGAVLLVTLTGCEAYAGGLSVGINIAPIVVAPPVVMQDDYVYYPNYGVYYNSSRNQYAYLEGGAWVSRPAPLGVSVDVLLASPSVRMNFHDSPANHHAAMVQQYPRNWAPSGSNQGQKENRKDDQHDGHGDNNGR